MTDDKRSAKDLIGKTVTSKGGRKFGIVADIIFETQNGELMNLVLKGPTPYAETVGLEHKDGEVLVPFHAVIAMGDFVVINEDDLF
ncbi:hypothetical protein GF342_04110 [Candidatus Woesearchaeota archaeon]|nr:hypothetical protein [Candidatus Woesearchaeota archaeon]